MSSVTMNILGISSYYHDSAAALLQNGTLVAAVQEERHTRIKHDARFPKNAIHSCLQQAKLPPHEIDFVVYSEKPFLKFDRLFETALAFAPRGFSSFRQSMPIWLTEKLFQKRTLVRDLNTIDNTVSWNDKLRFSEHHLSHAASAFFPSPYSHAAILTLDGVGEWATASIGFGSDNSIQIHKELNFPHSLGLIYSAFTTYCGFKVNSGEYKLMGLSPYGVPRYTNLIKDHLIDIKEDGSFRLNMKYFGFATGINMTNDYFAQLFKSRPRKKSDEITQHYMDLAASVQAITEEIVLKITKDLAQQTTSKNLCLAGGVALNCVVNGKIQKQGQFENIWIQPAAGDAGGSVGAAFAGHHIMLNNSREAGDQNDQMKGSYLGESFSQPDVIQRLACCKAVWETMDEDKLIQKTAKHLAAGEAIGWFQGRAEFGPRSLGNRSILADPRSKTMQKQLNLKIKYRESFRPFAPSILRDFASEYFDIETESPYMLLVSDVAASKTIRRKGLCANLQGFELLQEERSVIPAVTHVNYSARVQTVDSASNPLFYKLLKEFLRLTGCPLLVNTSFNVRGEPIVNTPEDAFQCFMGTDLDCLVVESAFLQKAKQNLENRHYYIRKFEED